MLLTKQVEDAKSTLAGLRQRLANGEPLDDSIRELEAEIMQASEAAGRLIRPDAF
jgi:hypothetical protein